MFLHTGRRRDLRTPRLYGPGRAGLDPFQVAYPLLHHGGGECPETGILRSFAPTEQATTKGDYPFVVLARRGGEAEREKDPPRTPPLPGRVPGAGRDPPSGVS